MKKIALGFLALAMSMAGPSFPASAQATCQAGMDYIIYWYDGPPPTGPLVGIEYIYCDGLPFLQGSYGTHDSSQDCGPCPT